MSEKKSSQNQQGSQSLQGLGGQQSSQGTLSRRSFLKAAGVAAGAAGLAGAAGMITAESWLAPAQAHADTEERVAYTFHYRHCQCNCHLKCTVRDGRMVLVEPNDWPDKRNETICVKGISEVQHVYSADRIQTPLKRVGERGSGQYVQISWDEALDTIAEAIKRVRAEYGPQALCTWNSLDALSPNLDRIVAGQSKPHAGIDVGLGNGFAPAIAESTGQGCASNEVKDWKNARTILNVNCNILESCMVNAQYFFEAKEAGAEIITVDPVLSATAAKSSQWVATQPGTDGALYLGMITLILDNGWYDEGYLKRYTSMPFLVSAADGSMLRSRKPNSAKEKGSENPFMVIDKADGSLKPYDAYGIEVDLEGSIEIDGIHYATVFSLLRESQKPYTLSWASGKTTIPEDKIYEITQKYACNGPSILSFGFGGADKFTNADVAGHAAVILATLVGTFGREDGAGAGSYIHGTQIGFGLANFPAWPLPSECTVAKTPEESMDARDELSGIRLFYYSGSAPQQRFANKNRTMAWLDSLDLVVSQDVWHNPSVDCADIILPACSHFELDEEIGSLRAFRGHILLQQKVIDPLFESKTDFWIENEIAKRLGYGDAVPESLKELAIFQLETTSDDSLKGHSLEELVAGQGIIPMNNQPAIGRKYLDHQFKTVSGRIDLYYESLVSYGQALPIWEEPNEAYEENPLKEKYPLIFVQKRSKYHIHGLMADSTWIHQFITQGIEMNPIDAFQRGISQGDAVEIFNDRGSFSCVCSISEAIRPGCVYIVEGLWDKYMLSGSLQNVTNDVAIDRGKVLPKGRVVPFNDTLVEVRKA